MERESGPVRAQCPPRVMQSPSAELKNAEGDGPKTALDSFLEEEEPAPSCAVSELSSLSDDEPRTAHDAWVPTT